MQHPPCEIEFAQMPHSSDIDAVARRRMRGIEAAYPSVLDWYARIEAPQRDTRDSGFGVMLRVHLVGGRALHGDGHGHDALAALRLAFNALEIGLEEDQASARARATAWLAAVRQRMRGWPEAR